ncbi:lysophosphatidylserine lipase ABHD12-like isoform X1 [Lineus longissimus]|uniref:lysophosphatidylserine lipase ABHD12-like isoform X1 n=1 Tax=Lineus longissimus TaxID=88925 RepID=UPI002B4F00B6
MRLRSGHVVDQASDEVTENGEVPLFAERKAKSMQKRHKSVGVTSFGTFLCRLGRWKKTFYIIGTILFFLYVIVPTLLYLFPSMIKIGVFLTMMHWPIVIDFNDFGYFKLTAARNFRVPTQDSSLGVWHIPPKSLVPKFMKDNSSEAYENSLSDGYPIILYFHGNAGTRARHYRIQFYKVATAQQLHVLAFDYRGFADSPGEPTENGMVEDGYTMLKWIRKRSGKSPVFLWGHSLGSGVATKLSKQLSKEGFVPNGLVLEAPISSMRDAAFGHPLGALWRYMPFFEAIFLRALEDQHIYFNNVESIGDVSFPILLMHAEDDGIVPYDIGLKLVEAARKRRSRDFAPFKFISFEAEQRCGHYMFRSKDLPDIIDKFVKQYS